jgi:hypothetical protein
MTDRRAWRSFLQEAGSRCRDFVVELLTDGAVRALAGELQELLDGQADEASPGAHRGKLTAG